jgi:hypothetical protein
MRRFLSFSCAALVAAMSLTTLSAQQAAAPAAPAPTHDVVFDVQGQQYVGVTTFAVDKAGKVTGTMKLTDPALVNGKLNGEITDGVWKFAYPFTMDNQGQACEGTVAGTAKVTADRSEATGEVSISGSCSPEPLAGVFKFTKKK